MIVRKKVKESGRQSILLYVYTIYYTNIGIYIIYIAHDFKFDQIFCDILV